MSKVSKEITMCINIILMIFISHVGGVKGYVHNMHTFNGKHVGGVKSLFDLHLGFQYKVFELHRTSNKVFELEQNSNK